MHGYTSLDVLLYTLGLLGRVSIRKLSKILFLVEFEERGSTLLRYVWEGEPVTRMHFVIGPGVVSPVELDALEEHGELFTVSDAGGLVVVGLSEAGERRAEEAARVIPPRVRERIEAVVSWYSGVRSADLARLVAGMLLLDCYALSEYRGVSLEVYLADAGIRVVRVDLSLP